LRDEEEMREKEKERRERGREGERERGREGERERGREGEGDFYFYISFFLSIAVESTLLVLI
jgi:hypothetical protein